MERKSWSLVFALLLILVPFAAVSDDGDERFEFTGAILSLPSGGFVGDWGVAGTTVHVTALTRIEQEDAAIAVGAIVEVRGMLRMDGSVDAARIEVERAAQGPGPGPTPTPTPTPTQTPPPQNEDVVEIRGAVQTLASTPGFIGDWTVAGRTVHVTPSTRIEQEHGALAAGAVVEVKGVARADGSIDATRVEVEWGPAPAATVSTTNTWMLPSSAHKAGREGSFFTTDVTLSNLGTSDATVNLKFLGHDRDGRQGPQGSFHLAAGATVTLSDIVGSFFGLGDDFGAIRITSNVPTLVIRSRTTTPSGDGRFGQDLDAAERNDLITSGRARFLAGVREDARFRTNLALANATEEPLDVDIAILAGDGRTLGSRRAHLEPLEMIQINDVGHELAGSDVRDGRIQLGTSMKGGAFTASASVIDNVTNDSSALVPR